MTVSTKSRFPRATRSRSKPGVGGALLTAFLFVLVGPGIHVVRADPAPDGPMSVGEPARIFAQPPAAPAPDPELAATGPQACEDKPDVDPRAQTRQASRTLQEKIREAMAADGDDPPIVLNGRGYRYGNTQPDAMAEMRRIEREVARSRR